MKNRNQDIDFIKGMLILCMIYGHMATALKAGADVSVGIHSFVRTFDMPFFAFLTGYYCYYSLIRRGVVECLVRKTTVLLECAVLWNIIWDLISYIVLKNTLSLSLDYFWYLWSIFNASCIVLIVGNILKKNIFLGIVGFIFVLILTHIGFLSKFNTGFLLFFCVVGFCFAFYKEYFAFSKQSIEGLKLLNGFIFIVLVCFWDGSYSIWDIGCNIFRTEDTIGNCLKMIYRGLIGLSGIVVFYEIFSSSHHYLESMKIKKKIAELIIKFGQNSLAIYILQTLIVEQFFARLVSYFIHFWSENYFLCNLRLFEFIIIPSFTFIVSWLIYYVQDYLKKIPIVGKVIFGMEKRNH